MDVLIKHQTSFALAVVKLGPSEEIKAEPGSMVSHTSGFTTDTNMAGGMMGGQKRMIGGEDLFQNTWKGSTEGGEITLAPTLSHGKQSKDMEEAPANDAELSHQYCFSSRRFRLRRNLTATGGCR